MGQHDISENIVYDIIKNGLKMAPFTKIGTTAGK